MTRRDDAGAVKASTALWLSVAVVVVALAVVAGVLVLTDDGSTAGEAAAGETAPSTTSTDASGSPAASRPTATAASSTPPTPSTSSETPMMDYDYNERGQRASNVAVLGNPWPEGAPTRTFRLDNLPDFEVPEYLGCLWMGKEEPFPPHYTCLNDYNHRADKFQSTGIISLVHCQACSMWTVRKVVGDRTELINHVDKKNLVVTGSYVDRSSDRTGAQKVTLVAGVPIQLDDGETRILLVWWSVTAQELSDTQHTIDSLVKATIRDNKDQQSGTRERG